MPANYKESADRANLLPCLKEFQSSLIKNPSDGDRIFDLIFKIWERSSEELWAWGYWQDYIQCGEIVLQCAAQLQKRDIQGRTLNEIGWVQMERGKFEIAQSHFLQSLQIFHEIGDRLSEGQSLRYLGVLYFRRRYFGSALKHYQRALKKTLEVRNRHFC